MTNTNGPAEGNKDSVNMRNDVVEVTAQPAISRESRTYDAIVIGSGMGGLATASILAQVGKKRVLVLESHFKAGGFLHSFRRKKYVWDPGVHYIGEMQDGSLTRKCMDFVTRGEVKFHQMRSPFEKFIFPQGTFDVPTGQVAYQEALIDRFPTEKANIKRFFRDVLAVQSWSHRWFFSKQYPEPMASLICAGRSLAMRNTREYLEERFDDPFLRAIVTAQWPDYGTTPGKSVMGAHATVISDFFNGGFYPIGGSQVIADSAVRAVRAHGGDCLTNHPVKEILAKNGRAYGVTVEHKGETQEFLAPAIISNAGAWTTFSKLLPLSAGAREREKLGEVQNGTSANILYLGLREDPRTQNFGDCNYWLYDRLDHDAQVRQVPGEPYYVQGCFLSFGSLRNPEQEAHTAQIVAFSRESEWADYDGVWKKRGSEYENRKAEIANAYLDFVELRLPGLRSLVEYQELSSPLTVKSFTQHHEGAIYGQECDERRLSRDHWSIGTSVKGLYLTGCDITLPGVNSALMAGVMTAGKLLGWLGMPKVMKSVLRA